MDPTGTTDDVDRPLGPDAAAILATEHWSLLATRTMVTSERLSRTAVFLTMLSAAIVAPRRWWARSRSCSSRARSSR
jgi:hypothetical protein